MIQNNQNQRLRLLGAQIQAGNRRTHTAELDLTHIDESYKGTFKYHHPSLIERMQIGVIKTQLLQGLEGVVDVFTDNIAHMTATLEIVLDEAPEWFRLDAIYDYEVLDAVYEEYIGWYNSFRKRDKDSNNEGNSQSK